MACGQCDSSRLFDRAPKALGRLFPEPTVLNVGVVSPRKQQVEVLALARRLHQEGRAIRFVFVGSVPVGDPYGKAFLAGMNAAEKEGYAAYLGTKETAELIDLFDQADALIHFPLEEAFGLVAAEAMARNLKLFGSATGGLLDFAGGVSGAELYPPSDWEGLEKGVLKWVDEGGGRAQGAAAAMADFHPRHIAMRHLEIYREVLGITDG